jgi:crossover junction endodeoxyribonuclease RuvC
MAIDSGFNKTGYCLFEQNDKIQEGFQYLSSGMVITPKVYQIEDRLNMIYQKLQKLIVKNKPDIIVLEQLFFFKNQKTAIRVSQAQGVILLLASQHKIPIDFLTPLQIKQIITGYGLSDKKNVQKMIFLTLKIKKEIKEDDEVDAIACALAYCYQHRNPLK